MDDVTDDELTELWRQGKLKVQGCPMCSEAVMARAREFAEKAIGKEEVHDE